LKQLCLFVVTLAFMALVTVCTCIPMMLSRCLRVVVPIKSLRQTFIKMGDFFGWAWCYCSVLATRMVSNVKWELVGLESIPSEKSCLIVSNHSSWFDIPAVLKAMMHTKIAVRFFVKRPILYIPLIGLGAWGIDCPFMRRYSKKYLQDHPERVADDAEETKKACAVFQGRQVFLLNYLEGTRFSKKKRELQGAEYKHLLKPKAGGVASALQAMGEQIQAILDFTISYPQGKPSCVGFICGKPFVARVHVRAIAVPDVGSGDYLNDPDSRLKYQNWVNGLWREKDLKMDGDLLRAAGKFVGQLP